MRLSFTVDWKEAKRTLDKGFQKIVEELPPLAAKIIAREIRQGKSSWRVDTGYSKRNFHASGGLILNRADYAKYVEGRYGDARKYVDKRMPKVANSILIKLDDRYF